MTVTLYALPDIKDVLTEDGLRTWIDVQVVVGCLDDGDLLIGMDLATTTRPSGGITIHNTKGQQIITFTSSPFTITGVTSITGAKSVMKFYRFTFATEGDAMAFRLRYDEHLTDRPSHPDCDDLMAMEAA